MEAFRFAHAARLLLDHQLSLTGPVPADLEEVVQEATLTAFQNLVQGCLEQQPAFLLLVGDTFDQADHSPRALQAFVEGCDRLDEARIDVVIAPGGRDPAHQWPDRQEFPCNVHLLDDQRPEAVIRRQGREVALVRLPRRERAPAASPWLRKANAAAPSLYTIALHGSLERPHTWPPVSISEEMQEHLGISPVDYCAGAGANCQWHEGEGWLACEPGPLQGLSPSEAGPRGYLLVDVGADRRAEPVFHAAAPVRFQDLTLEFTSQMHAEQLPSAARAVLDAAGRAPCETLWLVTWNLVGEGALLEELADPRALESTWRELDLQLSQPGFRVQTRCARKLSLQWPAGTMAGDLLFMALEQRLAACCAATVEELAALPARSALRHGPWQRPMEKLAARLEPTDVAGDALRLGGEWLARIEDAPP
jgi:hypothetical protein